MRHIFYNILNQKKPYNTPVLKFKKNSVQIIRYSPKKTIRIKPRIFNKDILANILNQTEKLTIISV